MARQFNILIGRGVLPTDRELFFGPLINDDIFHEFPDDVKWDDVLGSLKIIFQSKGDARRNGWDKEIPEGWSDFIIGKKKDCQVCVLKITKFFPDSFFGDFI